MTPLNERYADQIVGVLGCYDRIVITGTLPGVCYAEGMARYLRVDGLRLPLEHGAHRSVGVVAHPPGDISRARATDDGIAKADALNMAADRHAHLLSRRRSPPDPRAERTGMGPSG